MCRHRSPVDDISHDVLRLLLRAYGRNDTNDADDRFLSALSTRHVTAIAVTQIDKVLHALHSHCKEAASLYMVMTTDGSVRRGRVMVDLTEGETAFLETVQVTSHSGIVHVDYFVLVLMDAQSEQLCADSTRLPRKNPDKRVGVEEISQVYAGTS